MSGRLLKRHVVDPPTFHAVARARGGAAAVKLLQAGQLSKRMLLVAALHQVTAEHGHGIEAPYQRLVRMNRQDPRRWRAVMLHPYLDEGAARTIAAMRAGEVADTEWFHRLVHDAEAAGATWGAAPLLQAECDGRVWEVRLADRGPFREVHGRLCAEPLADEEVQRWATTLQGAWEVLVRRHPWHADAVAACLTALVPLRPAPDGTAVSSAARRAFGAVAASRPADPVLLALTLVHEFLHVQLGALLDLVPLHGPPTGAVYRAPWRTDPRPAGALLQGTYAHLGVTDFWRTEADAGTGGERARHEYETWGRHSLAATRALLDSGELLPAGTVFVTGIREALLEHTG
ncbi:aKG-HExxH-type peptide beta-hydroxylase [Streptomyces sp. NPDC008092]|uniref:aKG-HExxH-type peptide beta-hydroxylase n=1 Tax=Streptomyces sp. NPDC008092 TaxID=3364808 RepID=UPI0036ED2F43